MKLPNVFNILSFVLAAFKSVNWLSTAVNFGVILFTLVFRFKALSVLFAVLITILIILLDYSISLINKKQNGS